MTMRMFSAGMMLVAAACACGCSDAGAAAGKEKNSQGAASTSACPATAGSAKGKPCCPVLPSGHPSPRGGAGHGATARPPSALTFDGTVAETLQASRYTYVRVVAGTNEVWAAAPQFPVAKGDKVAVPMEMPMKNFRSDTLKRTFDVLYMAGKIPVTEKAPTPQ